MPTSPRPVLITGFEPYGGHDRNPSAEIAQALDGLDIAGNRVHGQVLPVSHDGLESRLRQLIDGLEPRLVIGLGLCPGAATLRLERVGVNLADFEIPDNEGVQLKSRPLLADGPAAYLANLPLAALQSRLLAAGIPARCSNSAGLYLCNAMLYLSAHLCCTRRPAPLYGFIHLPYLPEQAAARIGQASGGETPSMSLDLMIRGIRLAMEPNST